MSAFNINRGSSATNPLYMQLSGGIIQPVRTVTADDTATTSDYLVLADATDGAITETLPSGLTSTQTMVLVVKKSDSSAHTVTLSSSDDIDGQNTLVLYCQYSAVTVQWNGSTWSVTNFGPGIWQSWTPGIAGSGSMTLSATSVAVARFIRYRSEISFELSFSATLGGTASTDLIASLPIPSSAADDLPAACQIRQTSNWPPSVTLISSYSPADLDIFLAGSPAPNYTLGSVIARVSGRYPTNT